MLEEILMYLNNWFVKEITSGEFTIEGGALTPLSLLSGQYYRILGSVLNDGLHQEGEDVLKDETFTGTVWTLAVPNAVVKIAAEISEWQEKYGAAASAPYASESFSGEYSYTKSSGSGGTVSDWKAVFASRLAPWKKLMETAGMEPTGYQDPPFYRPYIPGNSWR